MKHNPNVNPCLKRAETDPIFCGRFQTAVSNWAESFDPLVAWLAGAAREARGHARDDRDGSSGRKQSRGTDAGMYGRSDRAAFSDRGLEMAQHKSFTMATDVQVYFCDPQSPWQRGSNENTNGLLRQRLPKNADLSCFSQSEFDEIALRLNQRPRKTLEFQNPADELQASVAPNRLRPPSLGASLENRRLRSPSDSNRLASQ
jgi:hypothetical protein